MYIRATIHATIDENMPVKVGDKIMKAREAPIGRLEDAIGELISSRIKELELTECILDLPPQKLIR